MKHDSLQNLLTARFAAAIAQVAGTSPETTDAGVRPAGDPKFGDYQCNAAMALARTLRSKPRDVAQRIVDAVTPQLADIAEPLEIAGPGFINIRLRDAFLAEYLGEIPPPADSDRVGLAPVERPQRVVVEYSQPNIAKQMHVGHLRSTIIGDVFARVLAFEGHEVIRQNHIGDWGTQFGMLIRWYREHALPTPQTHTDVLEAIEADYKAANERFQRDEAFAAEARRAVGELQSGDAQARHVWEQIRDVSLDAVHGIYGRLGVLLRTADVCGESFYNERLAPLVGELRARFPDNPPVVPPGRGDGNASRAVVREDAGAVVVYLYDAQGAPLFKNADGDALGMIIQKSDGAFLYATTDLAAIRFRLTEMRFPSGVGAQRVIYVTDDRQKLHFQQFLACARAAGWITDQEVDHVTFGSVLGEDRKPLKTRTGGTIKLSELLDEAEGRARALLDERDQGSEGSRDRGEEPPAAPFTEDEKREIARRIGIASVKYADLRNDRNSPYVFSWDKMISFQGNTAPYMLYAYARIRSIYRKAAERLGAADVYAAGVRLIVSHAAERALALRLARLREAIDNVASELTPHTLCTYLYDLAADFMRFYESCPVLAAEDESTRLSRMRLCDITARTLKLGLALLGIEVIERM
ncbi:MAG: arginine--tRNA ligase [Phycisphaerae bacterium]|nr:arginine--tRNA ligase [Phycisphaerae bacterium]